MFKHAFAALLAALALSAMAAAAPAGGDAPAHVLFARSCGDCSSDAFCELAYPGAPDSQVACVKYARGAQHLYRRYAIPYTTCTGKYASCSGVFIPPRAENIETAAACQEYCDADNTCVYAEWNPVGKTCDKYSSIAGVGSFAGGANIYVKNGGECPPGC
ncbi:hypothetical protein DFJ74DRAFT_708069 [Hyaloraphidium curvatum]|nr:hypothetical protein DFJ74DRAFT_708069 [Hyaloraphidium curvatum]